MIATWKTGEAESGWVHLSIEEHRLGDVRPFSLRNHRILSLSLSYDHRVVDSAEVVCFTGLLREDIRSLLL